MIKRVRHALFGAFLAAAVAMAPGHASASPAAAGAPSRTIVCLVPGSPSTAAAPALPALRPLPNGSIVVAAPLPRIPATGTAPPALPSIVPLTVQGGTRTVVVPTTTPLPGAPGVSVLTPQVLVLNRSLPRRDAPLQVAQQLTQLRSTAASHAAPVICY
jgi:hypothetical protein